jgi:exodeoxyribonuclease-3
MKNFKIISWNVNGIRAISKKGFFEWLEKENPDILCVQETKAWKEQLDDSILKIGNYQSYFAQGIKKGYSGVAIYSKQNPIQVKIGLGEERFDNEGRTLIAEYEDFVLYNIYYPNGKRDNTRLQYKLDFYETFQKSAEQMLANGKKIIICGDVNTAHKEIDLARPKENQKVSGFLQIERDWIDRFLSAGFIDTLRMYNQNPEIYTWWDQVTRARERNVGWRIDYFFISENLKNNIKNAFTLPEIMGSDHCPVGIDIQF